MELKVLKPRSGDMMKFIKYKTKNITKRGGLPNGGGEWEYDADEDSVRVYNTNGQGFVAYVDELYIPQAKTLIIDETIANIYDDAFFGSSKYKHLVFNGTTQCCLYNRSFGSCSFETIDFGQRAIVFSYTSGTGSFANCYNLTSLTIPGSIEEIGFSAFNFCQKISKVVI